MITIFSDYLFPCLCASMACFGFTLVFNIHGAGRWIACAGGGLGWLVYLLCGGTVGGAFLAAAFIGLWSEALSRLRRCPVTGYLLVALLPLVPGGGIYYAMRFCLAGETENFLNELLRTLGMASALAVGSMLASSLFRSLIAWLQRLHTQTRSG